MRLDRFWVCKPVGVGERELGEFGVVGGEFGGGDRAAGERDEGVDGWVGERVGEDLATDLGWGLDGDGEGGGERTKPVAPVRTSFIFLGFEGMIGSLGFGGDAVVVD